MHIRKSKNLIGYSLFGLIILITLGITFLYFLNIYWWGEGPNLGWGFSRDRGFNVVAYVYQPGKEAGLRVNDEIMAVNGKKFSSLAEARKLLDRSIGGENTYLIKRDGSLIPITIETKKLGFKNAFLYSGLFFLVGIICFGLGVLVFIMKPNTRASWVFLIMMFAASLQVIFFHKQSALKPPWLEFIVLTSFSFVSATVIHFALIFPEERTIIQRHPRLLAIPYIISLALVIMMRFSAPIVEDVPALLRSSNFVYFLLASFIFLLSMVHTRFRSTSAIVRQRCRVILLGIMVSFLAPAIKFVINVFFTGLLFFQTQFYFLPLILFFPVSVGYAIGKHNLFDVDVIIRRTAGYILTTGFVAAMYGLLISISNLIFGRFEISKTPLFPLLFALGIVFLFNPLRDRIQAVIDKVFYRKEYDYREMVEKISEAMRSLMDLDQIVNRIIGTVMGAMFLDSGSVVLLDRKKAQYQVCAAGGERWDEPQRTGVRLAVDDALIRSIAERKKEITVYDIQEDPQYEQEKEKCLETFKTLQASLLIPLVYEEQLSGLIALGDKKSGKFYTREDINLLTTLANQSAVAIENAMLLKDKIEKERLEGEMAIARDMQMSMLPAKCPEIKGFKIAARSIPAKEVGGDFYDFIEMGEDRFGVVIGDVTGKGVSGALIMAASRSTFRMLSEERISVGETLTRGNKRLKKDIKKGMFVALLYAMIDGKDKSICLSSAGQTQPVLYSGATSEVALVDTEGDKFPLGILEDSQYLDKKLLLNKGDTMILYTDGIVEAMNEKEEIYGFERLMNTVKEGGGLECDQLLNKLMADVNSFVGTAEQHDDLTIMVVKAT